MGSLTWSGALVSNKSKGPVIKGFVMAPTTGEASLETAMVIFGVEKQHRPESYIVGGLEGNVEERDICGSMWSSSQQRRSDLEIRAEASISSSN